MAWTARSAGRSILILTSFVLKCFAQERHSVAGRPIQTSVPYITSCDLLRSNRSRRRDLIRRQRRRAPSFACPTTVVLACVRPSGADDEAFSMLGRSRPRRWRLPAGPPRRMPPPLRFEVSMHTWCAPAPYTALYGLSSTLGPRRWVPGRPGSGATATYTSDAKLEAYSARF